MAPKTKAFSIASRELRPAAMHEGTRSSFSRPTPKPPWPHLSQQAPR